MSDSFSTAPLVLVLLLGVIPIVAVYVWTALALSAVFGKIGQETWRAWVPIVNQVTLLMVAGMSGWLFLLVLIPGVGVVAFWVATVIAVHRINRAFGLGGGMTVLAAVLFPVWASVVGFGVARWRKTDAVSAPAYARTGRHDDAVSAGSGAADDARARPAVAVPVALPAAAVAGDEPSVPSVPDAPSAPDAPSGEQASAVQEAGPAVAAPSAWAPPPTRVPTAPVTRVAVAAVALDAAASDPAADAAPARRVPDAPSSDPVPWAPAPAPAPSADPAAPAPTSFDQRWASGFDEVSAISQPPEGQPVPARPVATGLPALVDDGATGPERSRTGDTAPPHVAEKPAPVAAPAARARLRTAPVDIDPALRVTRAPAAPRRDAALPGPEFPLDTADEVSAVAGAPVAGAPRAARGDVTRAGEPEDFVDQTVIARRRRVVWALQPASGPAIDLTADVVILGRQPASDPDHRGAQLVAVPDDTRTVSKTHARLELRGDRWSISDLGSTNGVMLPTLMGTEVEAEPGAELAPGERFLLGDAAYRLVRTDG
ncbi:DUF5684 domain-containing protein [Microbacterium sp. zg.Y625]|uniref:DUF5684 domain-containing protein n=1 Tax=Microbacterium jiangjiandongii TaxID=3049071 RepID=UPI00214C5D43|nr:MULTISPECIES: DUF5684 domain-containing protein [unclassified Microbacterium]MCR2793978.1 DUF5684 domain-containing protein [Microbacterium sp. zg.Y625]WIM25811.1 DUF5684 domain-containing protein [Microbacterium sp. zg-Y625]